MMVWSQAGCADFIAFRTSRHACCELYLRVYMLWRICSDIMLFFTYLDESVDKSDDPIYVCVRIWSWCTAISHIDRTNAALYIKQRQKYNQKAKVKRRGGDTDRECTALITYVRRGDHINSFTSDVCCPIWWFHCLQSMVELIPSVALASWQLEEQQYDGGTVLGVALKSQNMDFVTLPRIDRIVATWWKRQNLNDVKPWSPYVLLLPSV